MGVAEMVLDRVDKMLIQTLDELLEAEPWRSEKPVAVINEVTGALSAELVNRGHQLSIINDAADVSQRIAERTGAAVCHRLDHSALDECHTILYRLPRPAEALEETAWHLARWTPENVVVIAAQAQKHLRHSMNDILELRFNSVHATRGAFKSRALIARDPKKSELTGENPPRIPRKNTVKFRGHDLELRAFGLTFGSARLDHGTKLLLETFLDENVGHPPASQAIDLGSGNGSVITVLAQHSDIQHLIGTDNSASAVRSTIETLEANGYDVHNDDRLEVHHQDGLTAEPDHSAELVLLNPPFHDGTTVTRAIAHRLFQESARVLKPDGQLWCVWNAGLNYRPLLVELIGETQQVSRDSKFIVTRSIKTAV